MTPCKSTLDALQALAQEEADMGDSRALNVVLRLRKLLEDSQVNGLESDPDADELPWGDVA